MRPQEVETGRMATIKETLEELSNLDGYVGSCLADSKSGLMLGAHGGTPMIDLEVAAAGNTEVIRAKRKTMQALRLDDPIEDILITLGRQFHLIRPMTTRDGLFLYLVLDRQHTNLATGRMALAQAEKNLQF
jgi:hypothetical protein